MQKRILAGAAFALMAVSTPAYGSSCDSLVDSGQSRGLKFGKDAKKTTGIGALAGGVIGGLLGRATAREGEDRDSATLKGAVIGGTLGGAAGLAVGQVAERRRSAFESESAYLDCEISNAEMLIEQRNAELEAAKAQYKATLAEIEAMNAKIAANTASKRELKALRKKIDAQIASYDAQMGECKKEIEYFELVSGRKEAGSRESPAALKRKRQQLAQKRGELQTRYSQLARLKDDTMLASSSISARGQG